MAEEEDYSKLPLPERFTHKNWKVRKEGYEAAAKEFKTAQDGDPIVAEFIHDSGIWKGVAGDSNVAAQQEGLAALCAFLEIGGPQGAIRTRQHTITPIVEKGLTGRPAAKQSATEALLLYVELDRADPVVDELLPHVSHKQPKVIAATLTALTAIVHAYGCKTVDPKPIIKLLPKAYGHADKNVRAEAQNLTVEFYRWLREAMKPLFWNELKPVQQQDLEKMFEKVKEEPAPKQERLLRSQQAAAATPASTGRAQSDVADADVGDGEIDLEPEYMAVDVFPKIPKDFSDKLGSTAWKERKEALDELFTAVNVPAIEDGPFEDILRGCAKAMMKDANVAVVTVAANCTECIAKGLRKKFAKYRSTVLSSMLERLKEKKQSVIDALGAACDAVFAATGLSDLLEETLEFLKHKNPSVKLESARFLIRCLRTTKTAPQQAEVKSMAEAAKKLLGESQETPRNAGAEMLGVLWKIMGDRNMLMHLEGLDDIRKNKIKEYCEQAEVKAKWKPAPAPAPKAAPSGLGLKKAAPGKRPGTATKKAPTPVQREASPIIESTSSLGQRPTSQHSTKSAPSRSAYSTGMPPPGGLKKPGIARPGSIASPKRPATSGSQWEDTPSGPVPSRSLATPGRGLTGRPLAKPQVFEPSGPLGPDSRTATGAMVPSGLSSAERTELSELRAEAELLRQQNADLRTDKMRLQSQIHELQNQNAQLIEDHTRDVLTVKAKETQLVRARSDVDEAEERAASHAREAERLKKEVQRLRMGPGRESPSMETPSNAHSTEERTNGLSNMSYLGRPAYGSSRLNMKRTPTGSSAGADGEARDGEGKENFREHSSNGKRLNPAFSAHSASPSNEVPDPMSGAISPRFDTAPKPSGLGMSGSTAQSSRTSSLNRSQGEESWKRAAEVTQNLKARIELMKAKQNATRGGQA